MLHHTFSRCFSPFTISGLSMVCIFPILFIFGALDARNSEKLLDTNSTGKAAHLGLLVLASAVGPLL